MNKKLLCLIIFLTGLILTNSNLFAQEEMSDEKIKSSWYIGFGLGSGNGSWNIDNQNITFDEWGEGATGEMKMSLNFGVGAILTPNIHLGGEFSALSYQAKYNSQNVLAQINNYMIMLTYFPMETGFFVKGGGGYAGLVHQIGDSTSVSKGFGGLVGVGYDLWLGDTFNLGLNFDYSYQKYSGTSYEPSDSSFYSIYVSCYWF